MRAAQQAAAGAITITKNSSPLIYLQRFTTRSAHIRLERMKRIMVSRSRPLVAAYVVVVNLSFGLWLPLASRGVSPPLSTDLVCLIGQQLIRVLQEHASSSRQPVKTERPLEPLSELQTMTSWASHHRARLEPDRSTVRSTSRPRPISSRAILALTLPRGDTGTIRHPFPGCYLSASNGDELLSRATRLSYNPLSSCEQFSIDRL